MRIEIPIEEWNEVRRRVVPYLGNDERHENGQILLSGDGSRRRWIASDSFTLASLVGGSDASTYEVLVPERAVLAATQLGQNADEPVFLVLPDLESDDIRIVCGGTLLHTGAVAGEPAELAAALSHQLDEARVSAYVDRNAFTTAVTTAWHAPRAALDDERQPLFNISISPTTIRVIVAWDDFGFTDVTVAADGAGDAVAVVNPRLLVRLLDAADSDQVRVAFPDSATSAIAIFDGDWTGLLMPIDTSQEVLRPSVEQALTEVFGPAVTLRDHDGDYRLSTTGVPVYAHLAGGDPAVVHVFAVAIDGIEATPELLAEINDQNARTRLVRLIAIGNQVLVEADLVASTIDPLEIEATFIRVRHVANEIGPLMAIAYGGEAIPAIETLRWQSYLHTVIDAELSPGIGTQLVGPAAVESWPFDGPVHVITAANPNGRLAPDAANSDALAELAAHLTRAGVGFVRAIGVAADGSHAEDSLLTWTLTTEDSRFLGRRFSQDAIFEIDADDVRVVSCIDDETRGRPRKHSANVGSEEA
mgnify:FL=1